MNEWLQGKQFGMPRWAWLGLMAGGVVVGLYLRARSAEAEAEDELAESEITGDELPAGTMAYYADDPGLAGTMSVVGPPSGSVVPYESPSIPEGYPESFGILADVIALLGEAIIAKPLPSGQDPKPPKKPDRPGGGGPPKRPDSHLRPKKVLTPAELKRYQEIRAKQGARAAERYLERQAGPESRPARPPKKEGKPKPRGGPKDGRPNPGKRRERRPGNLLPSKPRSGRA